VDHRVTAGGEVGVAPPVALERRATPPRDEAIDLKREPLVAPEEVNDVGAKAGVDLWRGEVRVADQVQKSPRRSR
jgi:hypothetical protein